MNISLRLVLKILAVIILAMLAINFLDIDDRLYDQYLDQQTPVEKRAQSIWLPDYQLAADPIKLEGAGDQVSGMTWSPITESLYVIGRGETIVILEYSSSGKLLRTIPATEFGDVEGIAWMGGYSFVIAHERSQSLQVVEIGPDTEMIDLSRAPSFTFGIDAGENKGFEGLAWNPNDQGIYVIKERDPIKVFKITGLTHKGLDRQVEIIEQEAFSQQLKLFNRDLSGLHYDPATGHFLVLSDESHSLSELDANGNTISFLELDKGWHGLKEQVPQAEGVAMNEEGTIFVVSEPNLLYLFKKP